MSKYDRTLMFLFLFQNILNHKGGKLLQEIIILVLDVILLILKLKISPEDATHATATKHGIPFSKLWNAVPKYWK